jgi:transposase
MTRSVLTDAQWERIGPHCLGKATDPGRTGGDGRLFLEAALRIARTGSRWRDPPQAFGTWNTVFKRFRWVKADVFKRIFEALSGDPGLEYAMIDGRIVKVHRHGQGAKGGLRASPSAARAAAGPPRSSP